MYSIRLNEWEIVGFESSPSVLGGRVLPLIRHVDEGLYAKLSTRVAVPPVLFSECEIRGFAQQGRITLLQESRPAFPMAVGIFVTDAFFSAMSHLSQSEILSTSSDWIEVVVETYSGRALITFLSYDRSEEIFAIWAQSSLDASSKLLLAYYEHQDFNSVLKALQTVEAGLCVARDTEVRSRLFLRLGVALLESTLPERLDNVFELTLRREFPEWSWESFLLRVARLRSLLQEKAVIADQDEDSPQVFAGDVERIGAIVDPYQRLNAAIQISHYNSQAFPFEHSRLKLVIRELEDSDSVALYPELVRWLSQEPAVYYDSPLSLGSGNQPILKVLPLLETLKHFHENGSTLGPLGRELITPQSEE